MANSYLFPEVGCVLLMNLTLKAYIINVFLRTRSTIFSLYNLTYKTQGRIKFAEIELFLIPSYRQSFPMQRSSPMKLRLGKAAVQHMGRGNPWNPKGPEEAGRDRDQSCSQTSGAGMEERFPALEQQMCSSLEAAAHCALRLPAQSFRQQGASLEQWECRHPPAAQPGCHHTPVLIQEPVIPRNSDLSHIL